MCVAFLQGLAPTILKEEHRWFHTHKTHVFQSSAHFLSWHHTYNTLRHTAIPQFLHTLVTGLLRYTHNNHSAFLPATRNPLHLFLLFVSHLFAPGQFRADDLTFQVSQILLGELHLGTLCEGVSVPGVRSVECPGAACRQVSAVRVSSAACA